MSKKWQVLIPSLVATASMPLIGLVGCGPSPTPPVPPQPEPVAIDFATDSWETVCYYANQGLDKLCTAYNNCKPHDFIGKTRELVVNGKIHRVKVIGTNEDVYKVQDANHFCTLTFQFETLLTDSNGSCIYSQWNSSESSEQYWSSTIHNFLNNETDKSVYNMVKADNPWIDQYVRQTVRQVNIKKSTGWDIKWDSERFFLPCLSDLFSIAGLSKTDDGVISPDYVAPYYYENIRASQYTYFASNIKNDPVASEGPTYKTFGFLKKKPVNSETYETYWLCSPTVGYSTYAWFVNDQGQVQYTNNSGTTMVNNQFALSPCFCI